jgi:hypothetical protein
MTKKATDDEDDGLGCLLFIGIVLVWIGIANIWSAVHAALVCGIFILSMFVLSIRRRR